MYIQITTRCNMACEHCGFSCTAEGADMSIETFRKALQGDSECVTIGGGEPTIHPLFWQMIGEALGQSEYVWLAINGKETNTALALAKMAKRGVLGCALSQDVYHERINSEVISAFTKTNRDGVTGYHINSRTDDLREIRDVSNADVEIEAGRCDWGKEGCICEDLFCGPDGMVRACGCSDSPILGVVNDFELPDNWEYGLCHKQQEQAEVKV